MLFVHFILLWLYLGQIDTKVCHRPSKWWSHSLGGPNKLSTTNKDHHSEPNKTNDSRHIYCFLLDGQNVEECEESEKPPNIPGQLWWPSSASGAWHDIWWWHDIWGWHDNVTSWWQRPKDRWPEVLSMHCPHFPPSTSPPSLSLPFYFFPHHNPSAVKSQD